jgi:uncharacterized protein
MLDLTALRVFVEGLDYSPLFVTVSGAHLYGFPSPDSDVDLRGCHQLPLRDLLALSPPTETFENKSIVSGIEAELVSHDLGKYLRLLVKNNGYVLEQIFSPIIVLGEDFLKQLRPLAARCITKHHYHHYRGFYGTERKLLEKQQPKQIKALLYAYRVLLTGIHLLRTGEVEANLPRLADIQGLTFIPNLIAEKRQEKAISPMLDWDFHAGMLQKLELALDRAFEESCLPEERDRESINRFLIEQRLGESLLS